jgi:NADH-quinone oxidoreductase subunit N
MENLSSLSRFAPELWIMAGILFAFLGSLSKKLSGGPLIFVLLAITAAVGQLGNEPTSLFEGLIAVDGFTHLFRLFFLIVGALTIVMSAYSKELEKQGSEFSALVLTVVLGMMLMGSARNLLMAYLAMEMVSIISYALVASLKGNLRSREAGIKYIIFGGLASGAMLLGMSFLYGMTGSLDFGAIAATMALKSPNTVTLFISVVLILAGLGFKVSAAPFHMWAPDVYEGAPIAVTAFLSVGPKAAGFALLLRLFHSTNLAAGELSLIWPGLIAAISVATMFIGNLTALWQDNLKRLMAFSSVAHAGYLLMAVVLMNTAGMTAIVFYLFAYLLMNFGAFMVISVVADQAGTEDIRAMRGLWKRNPWLAIMMGVFLFSLTGLPPAFGFIGKFYLFAALIESGWIWLAIVGLLNSVISLAYYMRIAKVMLIDGTEGEMILPEGRMVAPAVTTTVVTVLAGLTLLFGIYWEPIRVFAESTFGMI